MNALNVINTPPSDQGRIAAAAERAGLVADAVARHHGSAVLIAELADAMPRRPRAVWRAVAAALARRDAPAATALAARDASWLVPLLAYPAGDPQLPAAIVAATAPPAASTAAWSLLGYPLAMGGVILLVLHFLAATVLPEFDAMFTDFGLELPVLTRAVLGFGGLARSGGLLALAALCCVAGTALFFVRPRRAPAAAFTRALATLTAAGSAPATALATTSLALAQRSVNAPSRRGPFTFATAAALPLEPAAAGRVLTAIADCQEDRAEGRAVGILAALAPVAVVGIGLLVSVVVLALFMPLIRLISGLS
jgi:hypothetical protein